MLASIRKRIVLASIRNIDKNINQRVTVVPVDSNISPYRVGINKKTYCVGINKKIYCVGITKKIYCFGINKKTYCVIIVCCIKCSSNESAH